MVAVAEGDDIGFDMQGGDDGLGVVRIGEKAGAAVVEQKAGMSVSGDFHGDSTS